VGRYSNIKVKGLLFQDFKRRFEDIVNSAITESGKCKSEVGEIFESKLDPIFTKYEDMTVDFHLKYHNFDLKEYLSQFQGRNNHTVIKYFEIFESFLLYVQSCNHIYNTIIESLRENKVDSTLQMTVALYGLVIRRLESLVSLLISGYPDGAKIIWRSLYEHAVILLVLALENDNELADKYFYHSVRGSKKKLESYAKHHLKLNFPPVDPNYEKLVNAEVETMIKKFGNKFLENDYGWADNLFPGNSKATFYLLEQRADMQMYRPFYLLCSESIHPNFNGFQNFMEGNLIYLDEILENSINDHDLLVDPMQYSIGVLDDINDYILYEFSDKDELNANLKFLCKLFDNLQLSFRKFD